MITDINRIKEELKGFSQIEFPYNINKGCLVKYLTIKDNNEYFYLGGYFLRYGNDSLILNRSNQTWAVPKYIKDKKGNILYRSKFFIPNDESVDSKEVKELKSIIVAQQKIIEKLTERLKQLS
tara:strand:- start:251 stop:619 length:369 start_codon:yes stop_codon:yes gene_type:complete